MAYENTAKPIVELDPDQTLSVESIHSHGDSLDNTLSISMAD